MSNDGLKPEAKTIDLTNTQVPQVDTTTPPDTTDTSALSAMKEQITQLQEAAKKHDVDFNAVLAKKDELLGEKKAEQEKARIAEEQKLINKGDAESFKQLLESSQKENQELSAKFDAYTGKIGQERLKTVALEAATKLSDGPNIALIADILVKRLKDVDGSVKVLDKPEGSLTVSTIADLIKEFQANENYKSLLRGTNANGGSAAGSSGNGVLPQAKEMSSIDFYKLTPQGRMDVVNKGIHIIDSHRRALPKDVQ